MAGPSILDWLRCTLGGVIPASEGTCPWCQRPVVDGDELVSLGGERYHADCALARLAQHR